MRFISEDTYKGTIGNPLSLNLYTYCTNNPVSFFDPKGHAPYYIGIPNQPQIEFDEDFIYDPNAKTTWQDYRSWFWWGSKLSGALALRPDLAQACTAYSHYRSGSGDDLYIDYEKAYDEDSIIRKYVNNEILSAQNAAERLYKQYGFSYFNMTGGLVGIPNGDSENWQKTIGAHNIWEVPQLWWLMVNFP